MDKHVVVWGGGGGAQGLKTISNEFFKGMGGK